jgi:hypothetical protein
MVCAPERLRSIACTLLASKSADSRVRLRPLPPLPRLVEKTIAETGRPSSARSYFPT